MLIILACQSGFNVNIVNALISAGANVNAQTQNPYLSGYTALMFW